MNSKIEPGSMLGIPHHVYLFSDYVLDVERGSLTKNGENVPLRPRSFEVLSYLVENPGHLISKDELIAAVWRDVVVTYDSLVQCVVEIRKALNDTNRETVRNLPRRGYLFDVAVERSAIQDISHHEPVRNGAYRWYLSFAAAIVVVGIVSIVAFGTGPVSNPAGIDAAPTASTGQLAGDSIVKDDPGGLSPRDTAREHYRKGRFFFNRRNKGDLNLAHRHYQTAVELDENQPEYWLGLAGTTGTLAFKGELDWQEGLELRKQALDTALTLDPLSSEAHIRLAQLHFQTGNDVLTAAYLDQALEIGKENALVLSIAAGIAYFQHRFDAAVELQRGAVDLEPLSFVYRGNLASYLLSAGQLDAAAAEYMHARELNIDHAAPFDEQLVKIRFLQHRYQEAEQLATSMPPGAWRDHGLAFVYLAQGRWEEASVVQNRMQKHDEALHAAQLVDIYGFSGDIDESFRWLQSATEAVFDSDRVPVNQYTLLRLQTSPFLKALHDDPRWARWLEEIQRRVSQRRS